MTSYSFRLNENQTAYLLKVLETRPLGEALEVFMSLMKQKQEQDGISTPAPNGGSHSEGVNYETINRQ